MTTRRAFLRGSLAAGVAAALPAIARATLPASNPLFRGELGAWEGVYIHDPSTALHKEITLQLADIQRMREAIERVSGMPRTPDSYFAYFSPRTMRKAREQGLLTESRGQEYMDGVEVYELAEPS